MGLGWLPRLEVGDHAVVVARHDAAHGLVQDAPAIGNVQAGAVVAAADQQIVDAPVSVQVGLIAQELPWQATRSRPSGSGAAISAMTAPQL